MTHFVPHSIDLMPSVVKEQKRNSKQAANIAKFPSENLANMFKASVDAWHEYVALFDVSSQEVLWYSNAFEEDTSLLSQLEAYIKKEEILSLNHEKFSEAKTPHSQEKPYKIDFNIHGVCYIYTLYIYNMHEHALIKIIQDDKQEIEFSRYLKDREKLFSRSRDVSVSEMASTLAHELNQPIGTLKNLLMGIGARLQDNEELSQAIMMAKAQTEFSASIIQRIRDYTKSKMPVFQPVSVNSLLHDCVYLLDWDLKLKNIIVIMNDYADDKLSIECDALMLQQVMTNLIRNAVDAMATTPIYDRQLIITADLEKSIRQTTVLIKIKDNGVGLNSNQSETLFSPFVSNKKNGMGIGLNICRSFVELHQGKLWLEENTDAGCTANIRFAAHFLK